jgi:hypothetical protein
MVDNFAIFISHALLALAVWKLTRSDALDADPGTELAARLERKPIGEDLKRG